MLDFSSSLYLGFRHPHRALEPWDSLTTGGPAALIEPARNRTVAQALAQLQGCERGVLAPSSLHLFWDFFGIMSSEPVAIYLDAGVYPIARWGVERAAARGVSVREFRHHDAAALRKRLLRHGRAGVTPLIVTDGFCPGCGSAAPVPEYLASAREFGGMLVIDDTQSLGILGETPEPTAPYGTGGGGVLRWYGTGGPEILLITSLAKGFGVPLAALCGSARSISRFERASQTRVHCSAPSSAAVAASKRALVLNNRWGDALRSRLTGLVKHFRELTGRQNIRSSGGVFPVQTLRSGAGLDPVTLYRRLLQDGIRPVLHNRGGTLPLLSFIITARHAESHIGRAAEGLERARGKDRESPGMISPHEGRRLWY